jgi:Tfp pilus assembly protein PilO
MKVSKREQILLTFLFIMICGFLYYNLYFTPVMAEIDFLNSEIDTSKTTLQELQLKKASVENMKVQLEEISTQADEELSDVIKSIDQPDCS